MMTRAVPSPASLADDPQRVLKGKSGFNARVIRRASLADDPQRVLKDHWIRCCTATAWQASLADDPQRVLKALNSSWRIRQTAIASLADDPQRVLKDRYRRLEPIGHLGSFI